MSPVAATVIAEALTRVRVRLTPPASWTREATARTCRGGECQAYDPDATCWCIYGAICAECGPDVGLVEACVRAVEQVIGLSDSGLTLMGWNDFKWRTHDDVLGVLGVAITRAQAATGAAA